MVIIVLLVALIVAAVLIAALAAHESPLREPVADDPVVPGDAPVVPGDTPPPAWQAWRVAAPTVDRHSYRVSAQLVSAEPRRTGLMIDVLLLDAVVEEGRRTEAGTPVTYKVSVPQSHVLAPVVTAVLQDWARDMRIVDVHVHDDQRMDITSEGSAVRVDVQEAVGIG